MSETRIRLAHTAMALFLFAGAGLSTHAQEPAASTTQTPSQSGAPNASTKPSDAQAAPAAGATATFETTAEVGTRQNPMVVVESVAAQQLRNRMAVEYPQSAIHAKISGSVKMQVLIGKSGRVIATRIIWGPDALRSAAESAVSRSEYLPMTLDGKPVFMATTVRLIFTVDSNATPPTAKVGEFIAQDGQATDADALRNELPFSQIARTPGSIKLSAADGVSHNVKAAKLIYSEAPDYPQSLKSAHIQGAVVLHGIIQKNGTVTDLRYVSGPQLLAPAAIEAVKKWRYEPTLLEDEPVEVDTTITVTFRLG
jgi:TonB family protein